MPISGRRKSEPPCNRKRFDAHRLFLYILKRARKWTRRGEESESEGTDWRTIREQSYLYMHARREKDEKEKESKEMDQNLRHTPHIRRPSWTGDEEFTLFEVVLNIGCVTEPCDVDEFHLHWFGYDHLCRILMNTSNDHSVTIDKVGYAQSIF
jgi:hypothetical protein